MFKVGDRVLTKECSDVKASSGKLLSFRQYVKSKRWSVLMRSGEVFLYWDSELELNPQRELFDMTCEPSDIY